MLGTKSRSTRQDLCIQYVNEEFAEIIGTIYVKHRFHKKSRQEVTKLINWFKEELRYILDSEIEWMDEDTKSAAKRKIDAMIFIAGYSDHILNSTFMNDKYSSLVYAEKTSNFYDLNVIIKRWKLQKYLEEIFKPRDHIRSMSTMGSAIINAFYWPSKNAMFYSAAFLQSPFYNRSATMEMNLGGIGNVIGHEITHGFDNIGRRYDHNGDNQNWWTNWSSKNFQLKTKCFIEAYSQFHYDKINKTVDGEFTASDNIADIGSIRMAYKIMMNYRRKNALSKRQENLFRGLTSEKVFFTSFAQLLCNSATDEDLTNYLATNEHTPEDFRVIGVMRNTNEFSKAFQCKPGSYMNPPKKCQMW